MPDKHTLSEALRLVGNEAAGDLLDTIACTLHNDGAALAGNTEAFDIEWLARELFILHSHAVPGQWDIAPQCTRDYWLDQAELFLKTMPRIAERIGHRMMATAKAVRMLELAMYRQGRADHG
jgi:hypothetical protein